MPRFKVGDVIISKPNEGRQYQFILKISGIDKTVYTYSVLRDTYGDSFEEGYRVVSWDIELIDAGCDIATVFDVI